MFKKKIFSIGRNCSKWDLVCAQRGDREGFGNQECWGSSCGGGFFLLDFSSTGTERWHRKGKEIVRDADYPN